MLLSRLTRNSKCCVLPKLSFFKIKQSDWISRISFLPRFSFQTNIVNYKRKARKKICEKCLILRDTYCGIYDLKVWINNATITKNIMHVFTEQGNSPSKSCWKMFVLLQLILVSFILRIIILWGLPPPTPTPSGLHFIQFCYTAAQYTQRWREQGLIKRQKRNRSGGCAELLISPYQSAAIMMAQQSEINRQQTE